MDRGGLFNESAMESRSRTYVLAQEMPGKAISRVSREKGEVSGCSQPCQPGLTGLWGKAYQRGSLTPSVLTATVVRLSSLDPVWFGELSLTVVGRDVGI